MTEVSGTVVAGPVVNIKLGVAVIVRVTGSVAVSALLPAGVLVVNTILPE